MATRSGTLSVVAKTPSLNDFGLVIAYLIPGLAGLWGASYVAPEVRPWFGTAGTGASVGGVLLLTLAAVAAGMVASTVRWLLLDPLLRRTGVRRPERDFSRLTAHAGAFELLIDAHYRYYQHYGNMAVALAWVLLARRLAAGSGVVPLDRLDVALAAVAVLYLLGARDALAKYYARTGALLRRNTRRRLPRGGASGKEQ